MLKGVPSTGVDQNIRGESGHGAEIFHARKDIFGQCPNWPRVSRSTPVDGNKIDIKVRFFNITNTLMNVH